MPGPRARRQTPLRKSLGSFVLSSGALTGAVLYRRRAARRIERVELYGPDGTMASIAHGTSEFERLMLLAREVLSLGA